MSTPINKKRSLILIVLLGLIKIYQKTISPDHSFFSYRYPYGFCRYRPTCSEYARQALERRGIFGGIWLSIKRVVRCNPFVRGGEDLVK